MFGKNDANQLFAKYGFNQDTKNDETSLNTAKAFVRSEYTVAGSGNGRNRLNSGILRNQFILLLDSLNGQNLTDDIFSGVSLLRREQFVLVHEKQESELWNVYQGNSPSIPKKIHEHISLHVFFDEFLKDKTLTENFTEESIEDRKTDFIIWLSQNCKGKVEFQKHVVDIIEKWLDEKIPNANIGNLFRFAKSTSYEVEKNRILNLSTWNDVNEKDQNGRPLTALNHYSNFLKESNAIDSSSSKQPAYPVFPPSQIIYYGVPGCGKSNTIKEKLKSVPDFNKVCVVFHPDYTNSEFIGQIRPKVRNHSVTYEFVAGPFAKILRRAYLNPNQEFYLVIDEINRGKASAILGEVFQLCDRIKPNDEKDEFGYGPGWSVYGVDHEDLNDYIRDIKSFANESHDGCDTPVEFSEEDGRGEVSAYKSIDINWLGFGENGKLRFTENTAIRLPPNLSIFATMNTSDQNVFTLDNAFQRRFGMELVRNEFAKGEVDGFKTEAIRNQHNAKIVGTETTWGEFWEWANSKITQVLKGLSSTEDKRLGVWFVCNVNGEISEKVFAEKVLKYLWDDAFKFKRTQIFAEGCDTLETLISKFHELKFGVFKSFGA
ncbi:MAG: AAA family ATPase [Fibrobacter sp.]|nr:AAA family ATPase [Fibrobacter sp.]